MCVVEKSPEEWEAYELLVRSNKPTTDMLNNMADGLFGLLQRAVDIQYECLGFDSSPKVINFDLNNVILWDGTKERKMAYWQDKEKTCLDPMPIDKKWIKGTSL